MFVQHRVRRVRRRVPRTHAHDVPRACSAWDSGYHVWATCHFDPASAATELSTLYRSNLLPDGLLSHQRFVPGAEDVQALVEDLFGPMFEGDRALPFVDPPTAAYAAARSLSPCGARRVCSNSPWAISGALGLVSATIIIAWLRSSNAWP